MKISSSGRNGNPSLCSVEPKVARYHADDGLATVLHHLPEEHETGSPDLANIAYKMLVRYDVRSC